MLTPIVFVPWLAVAAHAADIAQLGEGEARDGELVRGESHRYRVAVKKPARVFAVAQQQSVDVVLTVYDPQGAVVTKVDGPRPRGRELLSFSADTPGTYVIDVAGFNGAGGEYALSVERIERPARSLNKQLDQLFWPWQGDVPGAVIGVVEGGELVLTRAFGKADLNQGVDFAASTPTNIGSTSKHFTAFALLLLAERGALTLDDDVRTYLPELPDFGTPVTIRHLLTHTSGYREYINTLAVSGVGMERGDAILPGDLLHVVSNQATLQNDPGGEWNYNNTGYGLAARIVERVSGDRFPDWMRREVFTPLGMLDTQVRAHPFEVVPGRSIGYEPGSGGFVEAEDLGGSMGAGSIYASMNDLARWMANYRSGALGAGFFDAMTTPMVLNDGEPTDYGLGLFVDTWRGLDRVHHGGADRAHRSMIRYFPELDAGVIVQSNDALFDSAAMADAVATLVFADHLAPAPTDDAFDPADFDPADFEAFAGRYHLDEAPTFVIAFTQVEGGYQAQAVGQTAVAMVPISPTAFQLQGIDAQVTFHRDDDGTVHRMTLDQNGTHPGSRVTAPPPRGEALAPFVGRYFSDEVEAFIEIANTPSGLSLQRRRFDPLALDGGVDDVFTAEFPFLELAFERDEAGAVVAFVVDAGRSRDIRFTRITAVRSSNPAVGSQSTDAADEG